ncbi:antitoxin component HigA of HigAB toxin-antitoxin module [Chryseobacterium sp. H1D6B]|uniref:hypothetical protein n=1 Tax=Chryseobacterium sp. H1D6B TaxID=2940588 RepID=UPI0015C6B80B|nr:hypothetical protein [Chryseobacterium sp. H1D6B]MDH6250295.1 antitoxin component HigA of HigAB toxin-antitoxin module [Chryseobacterium sp. H1D6B]
MGSTYFFSAFGTFGNPNGFRQSFVLGGNAAIAREIRTFDLKTDAIKLFPQSSVYAVRKDYAGGCNLISYSIYTFAKEQNSDRGGTFIGSSLLFIGKVAPESLIVDALNEFHGSLEKNNVSDGTITINHSDNFSIRKPKDFDKIGFNLREIDDLNFVQTTNNYLVVYCETTPSQLQLFFNKAIELLNVYDTVYFTQSHEIGEFVKQKGIFKIVDADGFKKEIEKLHEERLRAVQNAVAEFENEKQKLKEERGGLIDSLNKQIEQNEKRHQENEKKIKESKNGINIINQEYEQYSRKIDEMISKLKSDGKVEAVKKLHNENKRQFINKINQNQNIDPFSSISASGIRTQGISNESPKYGNDLADFSRNSRKNDEKEFKLDIFKVATAVLSLLLIGVSAYYFMFLNKGKMQEIFHTETIHPENVNDTQIPNDTVYITAVETMNLNPFPNSNLNDNDRRLVFKKIKPGTNIDSVLSIIFKENPSSINDYYKHQKKEYAVHLYQQNPKSFTIKEQDTLLVDSLMIIPNYKKL